MDIARTLRATDPKPETPSPPAVDLAMIEGELRAIRARLDDPLKMLQVRSWEANKTVKD